MAITRSRTVNSVAAPELTWSQRVLPATFAVVGVALAASTTTRVFADGYEPQWVVLASVLGGLVAFGAHHFGVVVRAIAIVVGAVVACSVAVERAGGQVRTDVGRAVLYGVNDLMTATWPAPPIPSGVGMFALVAGLAGGAAVELAVQRRRPACLLPSLAVFGLVALLGAAAGPPPIATLLAYLVGSIALLRVLVIERAAVDTVRYGAVLAVIALVAVTVMDPTAEGRFDPRERLVAVPTANETVSPLARLDEWRSIDPAVVMFTTSSPSPSRWRIVGLTRYDGRSWLPADDYRLTGTTVDLPLRAVDQQQIDLTIAALDTLWWPMLDHTIASSEPVFVDSTHSGLLPEQAPAVGDRNELTVQVVGVDSAQLAGLDATQLDSPFVDDLVLPSWAAELATLITEGANSDYERASRLASYLSTEFVLDPSSPPGHSIADLEAFVQRSRRGRDEQFVAAYGVLAAAVGLPVRLAVGFDTAVTEDGTTTSATSDHVVVWPEVSFDGAGWVAFEPIPTTTGSADPGTGDGQVAPIDDESASVPTPSTMPPTDLSDDPVDPPEAAAAPTEGGSATRAVVVAVGGVGSLVLVLIGYVVVVLGLKRRRRQRRRASFEVADVALGAFTTSVDTMVDVGLRAAPSATDRELVRVAAGIVPGSAQLLYPVADRATEVVFSGTPMSPKGALESWTMVDEFEHRSAIELGRWRSWRGKVSTRSLRRRSPRR